jgi:hypothetical protein
MSNQRRPNAEQSDSAVSSTYRELAQERTPAHLDHVVLNEARRAAQSSGPHVISWLRPAAWVTTIGLCLAIVLEITDIAPQNDIPADDQPVVTENGESLGNTTAVRQKRSAPLRDPDFQVPPREEDAAGLVDTPAAAGFEAKDTLPSAPAETFKNETAAPVEIESPRRSDMLMLRDAEERARVQEGTAREQANPLSKGIAMPESSGERYCEEQETATPDAWIECIMRLQQEGRYEEARLEYDRLHETHPGAEIPPLTAPLPNSP